MDEQKERGTEGWGSKNKGEADQELPTVSACAEPPLEWLNRATLRFLATHRFRALCPVTW